LRNSAFPLQATSTNLFQANRTSDECIGFCFNAALPILCHDDGEINLYI